MRIRALAGIASFVALLGAGLGCSDSNSNAPTGNSFYGTYTDESGVPGTISLTGTAPATVGLMGGGDSTPLTGSLGLPGQAPIDLSGLYVPETGDLSFSSDDDAYTFNAEVTGASATGSSTGPNGPGAFVLFTGGSAASVAIFCGTAVCTSPPECEASAQLNLAVSGSTAALTVFANGIAAAAAGSRLGDNVSIHVTAKGADLDVTGVINGSTVGGIWSESISATSGTWNGNVAQCSVPPAD